MVMWSARRCGPSLVALVLLAMLAPVPQVHAQDTQVATRRPTIDVVPDIPHSSGVSSVAFSPEGSRVLSGSMDTTIRLWDAARGVLLRAFEGHSGPVHSVAFSPNGAHVLSASYDSTIRLWDAATGALLRTFEGHSDSVSSAAFSPDGTKVLSGGRDKTVRLWDAATGAQLRTFEGHSGAVTSVAFSRDGARVLSGSADRKVGLWDAVTGALLSTFEGHSDVVASVALSRDGARVLSGGWDKTVRLWDAATGRLLHTFDGYAGQVWSVAFSPDGARVLAGSFEDLSGSEDTTLRLWDVATGARLLSFKGELGGVTSVAFSPDGARLLSGNAGTTVRLWDAGTGALLRTFEGHADAVRSVAFSPDGARVLTGSEDKPLRLWDAATGAVLRTFEGHAGVTSVAFSSDGARMLSGGWDRTAPESRGRSAIVWDMAAGVPLRTFQELSSGGEPVALSPDGARVLSGSSDNVLRLWDVATGAVLRTFEGHSDAVEAVAFSPDGGRVLSGGWDKTVRLWDAATGGLLSTFQVHSDRVYAVAFSPDGARVLSGGGDNTLRLWDAATGALLRTFEGHASLVLSAAFSPDGGRILSGSADRTARLWDVATGGLLRTFKGHLGWVYSAAFSPDGRRIVSGSTDTTIRIWDTDTGAHLVTLIGGRDDGRRWLSLTPAGFFAGAGSVNDLLGIVRGLDLTTVDQVHQSLYNPDLVREALAGDPDGEVAKAANVINLEKVLDSGPAPSVAIASPAAGGSQSAADLVEVVARIEDRGKGLGRIEWRVNGITAAVSSLPSGSGPVYTITQLLALDPGDNVIEVVAYNGSNLLASLPARATVKFTGPADKITPKLHILAIGINAYVDKGWVPAGEKTGFFFDGLDLAVNDAKAFATDMEKAAAGLYDGVRITLALDQDATRDNLRKLVDKVAAQIHPRDTFILFAAAHGYALNGRFYLIPQDYQGGMDHRALATRAIGQDELQDWLANRIKAKRALVLLDTCESGALIAGHARSRTDAPASEAAVGRLHEATGRPVLTAAAVGQFAHEGEIGASGQAHGYFTWAVLDALRRADSNGNDLIELSELVAHVQTVVPKIVAKGGGRGQVVISEPVADRQVARFGSRGEDFVLARRLP
jgi:WD40 repeat protein